MIASFQKSLGRFTGESALLVVHLVVRETIDADGAESAEADVQCDAGVVDAALLAAGDEFWSEMEAGGGGGDGSGVLGVDGLVAIDILSGRGFAFDVMREGDFAVLIEQVDAGCLGREFDGPFALIVSFEKRQLQGRKGGV